MAIRSGSRLFQTDALQPIDAVTGNPSAPAFVDIRAPIRVYNNDDRIIRYDDFGSWGNLGLKYLLGAEYWWAIADMSEIVDPFTELTVDTELRAPTVERFQLSILPTDDA